MSNQTLMSSISPDKKDVEADHLQFDDLNMVESALIRDYQDYEPSPKTNKLSSPVNGYSQQNIDLCDVIDFRNTNIRVDFSVAVHKVELENSNHTTHEYE